MSTLHSDTVVIGVGSLERGDDAVGLLIARELRERIFDGLRVVESDGEATALVDLLATARHVIIVDAADFGGAAGEVRRYNVADGPVPQTLATASSHDFGLAQGIELARALGNLPQQCVIYAIQGEDFGVGAELTAPVRASIDAVTHRIANDIDRPH